MGSVYLVWAEGSCRYKIGMTQDDDPKRRVDALGTSCPFAVKLIGYIPTTSPEVTEAEMHRKWHAFRVNREWFEFGPFELPELADDFGFVSIKTQLDRCLSDTIEPFIKAMSRQLSEGHTELIGQMAQTQAQSYLSGVKKTMELEREHMKEYCSDLVVNMMRAFATQIQNGNLVVAVPPSPDPTDPTQENPAHADR